MLLTGEQRESYRMYLYLSKQKVNFILATKVNKNNIEHIFHFISFTDERKEIPDLFYYLLTMILTWNVYYFVNKNNLYSGIHWSQHMGHPKNDIISDTRIVWQVEGIEDKYYNEDQT